MKNVQEMKRQEVIKELAGYAHPTWYHSLLEWQDAQLKALLTYYRSGGKFPTNMVGRIYKTRGLGDPAPLKVGSAVFSLGIDWSNGEDITVITIRHGQER